eukprot:TRINITY_DN7468_c0_g1_i1.p1 TRINITY_DN7468_c0_g1~~TRINITY_DN7468_c0_g1_i1.p1  ORF type:complete len:1130 (+),score=321.13 TRINITY_DN7468_c0_g1_i1:494-3391(+)
MSADSDPGGVDLETETLNFAASANAVLHSAEAKYKRKLTELRTQLTDAQAHARAFKEELLDTRDRLQEAESRCAALSAAAGSATTELEQRGSFIMRRSLQGGGSRLSSPILRLGSFSVSQAAAEDDWKKERGKLLARLQVAEQRLSLHDNMARENDAKQSKLGDENKALTERESKLNAQVTQLEKELKTAEADARGGREGIELLSRRVRQWAEGLLRASRHICETGRRTVDTVMHPKQAGTPAGDDADGASAVDPAAAAASLGRADAIRDVCTTFRQQLIACEQTAGDAGCHDNISMACTELGSVADKLSVASEWLRRHSRRDTTGSLHSPHHGTERSRSDVEEPSAVYASSAGSSGVRRRDSLRVRTRNAAIAAQSRAAATAAALVVTGATAEDYRPPAPVEVATCATQTPMRWRMAPPPDPTLAAVEAGDGKRRSVQQPLTPVSPQSVRHELEAARSHSAASPKTAVSGACGLDATLRTESGRIRRMLRDEESSELHVEGEALTVSPASGRTPRHSLLKAAVSVDEITSRSRKDSSPAHGSEGAAAGSGWSEAAPHTLPEVGASVAWEKEMHVQGVSLGPQSESQREGSPQSCGRGASAGAPPYMVQLALRQLSACLSLWFPLRCPDRKVRIRPFVLPPSNGGWWASLGPGDIRAAPLWREVLLALLAVWEETLWVRKDLGPRPVPVAQLSQQYVCWLRTFLESSESQPAPSPRRVKREVPHEFDRVLCLAKTRVLELQDLRSVHRVAVGLRHAASAAAAAHWRGLLRLHRAQRTRRAMAAALASKPASAVWLSRCLAAFDQKTRGRWLAARDRAHGHRAGAWRQAVQMLVVRPSLLAVSGADLGRINFTTPYSSALLRSVAAMRLPPLAAGRPQTPSAGLPRLENLLGGFTPDPLSIGVGVQLPNQPRLKRAPSAGPGRRPPLLQRLGCPAAQPMAVILTQKRPLKNCRVHITDDAVPQPQA